MKKHGHVTRKDAPPTFLGNAAPPAPAGTKEILDSQREIMLRGAAKEAIEKKISEVVAETAKLSAGIGPAPDVARKREDLLAAIATDESTAEELSEFDASAAEAQKAHDSEVRAIREKIGPLEATAVGLKRKADHHTREIERLRADHRRLCQEYLLAQAEQAGKVYAEAINVAVDAMARAIAYGSLHKRIYGENSIGLNYEAFDAIGLGCDSTRGTMPPTDPVAWVKRFDDAEEEILAALRAEGLAIPFPESAAPALAHAPGLGFGLPVSVLRPPEPLRTGSGHIAPAQAITEAEEE